MMVYAPSHVRPQRVDRLASQIDVRTDGSRPSERQLPDEVLRAGHPRPRPARERAFLSTYQKLGFMDDNSLVVLEPGKKIGSYGLPAG